MNGKIALYWHNGRGLGHTSRSANLGKALIDRGHVVIGVTGASRGLELLPKEMDILKIPSYLAYDSEAGAKTIPIASMKKGLFQNIRANLISTFIADFSPDVLVVDYSPQGKKGELIPVLANSPQTKKVLGLRGVLDTPEESNRLFFGHDMVEFIERHYSAIHVYVDARVFQIEEFYSIPKSIRKMIEYTGYVSRETSLSKQKCRDLLGLDRESRIVVANFGGGQGTEDLWQAVIRALEMITDQFDHAFLAAGPYLEDAVHKRISSHLSTGHKFSWTRFLDSMHVWMKASDLFIGAGGYNTMAEIISTGANSLIIPRQLSEREQEIHSDLLSQMGILRTERLGDLFSDSHLSRKLSLCLSEPLLDKGKFILSNGASRNTQLIELMLSVNS